MKLIRTEDAVGHVLCHDMTQIIKDKYKDARFRKGHVVTEEDIPVLLSMGKAHLYVWEMTPGMVHENDAAERLLTLCGQENMLRSEVKEGKIELKAACDGVFLVDSQRLIAVNSQDEVMIATRRGGTAVRAGRQARGDARHPAHHRRGKAPKGRAGCGRRATAVSQALCEKDRLHRRHRRRGEKRADSGYLHAGRDRQAQRPTASKRSRSSTPATAWRMCATRCLRCVKGIPICVLCTGGMSVDPDDNTPSGIRAAGADIVCYGAPVLPGAMFLLGYFDDGTPVMGLPGCVMYAGATVFDLVLPKVAADVPVTRADIAAMGEGGLCLGCKPCRYPVCPFGK